MAKEHLSILSGYPLPGPPMLSSLAAMIRPIARLPYTAAAGMIALLLMLWSAMLPVNVHANAPRSGDPLRLTPGTEHVRLGLSQTFLKDDDRSLVFDDVRQRAADDERWEARRREIPSWGVTRAAIWSRLSVINDTDQREWMFEHTEVKTVALDVWVVYPDGQVVHREGGTSRPRGDQHADVLGFAYAIDLPKGMPVVIYTRVASDYGVALPQNLRTPTNLARGDLIQCMMHMLYIGVAGAMILYNLFVYAALREKSHLYYVLAMSGVFVGNNSISGMTDRFVLDFAQGPSYAVMIMGVSIMVPLLCLFSREFLRERSPLVNGTVYGSIALTVLALAASTVSDRAWTFLCVGNGFLVCNVFLWVGVRNALRGDRSAVFYLLGFVWFLLGSLIFQMGVFGILPYWSRSMEIGSCIEAVMLSIALAERMRQIRFEKNVAEREALAQKTIAMEQQQIALRTVEDYSRKLEAEVKARTEELVSTQQKLIASEKMAALGVFTAGMAHEINNPANFVSASVQNAEAQLQEFRQFVAELLEEDADPEITAAFEKRFSKLENSNKVAREGVARIERVVKQLRTDHPEGDVGMQATDIIATLESAWQMMVPTLKLPVTLSTDFGARPPVECAVAEVQQVFLALLSNAVHAMDDASAARGERYQARLTLHSSVEQDQIIISLRDNGIGIPPDKLDKIFDPFFTTKVVGRGAGLGLSMARDVVTRHGGVIDVSSVPAEGTTLTVRLPLSRT
jgi:two-component system NtrC family sensor kinase